MDRLGCSWAELGRRTTDCPKSISRTECQQSAQAQPGHFITKTINRLACSWAEMSIDAADCLEQSTLPRATSRPRRNRYNYPPLEKLTRDQSEVQVQGHKCAIPRDRGGREAKSLRRSGRDALSTSPPIPRTGRQEPHLLALQFVIMPYEPTSWAAARRVRITRRRSVGGAQPIRG